MAKLTKKAKNEASKGSTARGTKNKPSIKNLKKTTSKSIPVKKANREVITASISKKSKTATSKRGVIKAAIEKPTTVVLKKEEPLKAINKATTELTTTIHSTTPSSVELTNAKTVKVEGEETLVATSAKSTTKDVDVMLLGGKVIDLRPAESETKPKSRKKLQWTPARRKYVAEYLADAQLALRLSDWEITLVFGVHSDPEGDTLATMTANEDQRRATMRFGKEFFDLNPNEMRQTIIHEMIHCHLFPAHHNAERTVIELGGKRAGKAFTIGMMSMIEVATDSIADSVAPFFPTFELPER